MKQCPRCNRNYSDDALSFCLEDGTRLTSIREVDATLISAFPPMPVIPPTVAFQEAPRTETMQVPRPTDRAFPPVAPAPPRRSPWVVGVLVIAALAVGLTIGGIIFQRTSSPTEAALSVDPDRNSLASNTTPPAPVSSTTTATPTPTPVQSASPKSSDDQTANVRDQACVLYNDKTDRTVVNVRENCDTRNCEIDASTLAGEYPDNTPVQVVAGSNVQTGRFTWVKVIITSSRRTVWVASSKIKCK